MKQLAIFMLLLSFLTGTSISVFSQQSTLEGTWLLNEVKYKSQNINDTVVISIEEIPEELYYTCPIKITFEEQLFCTLYYNNEEEKQAMYYIMPGGNTIYFSIPNETSVPERTFFLDWNREEQSFLQLQYTGQEEQYIYYYQLQDCTVNACPDYLIWTGESSVDWNDAENWKYAENWEAVNPENKWERPAAIGATPCSPGTCTNVWIPANVVSGRYPDLTPISGTDYTHGAAQCNRIYFEHGGEVVRTDILYYTEAFVELRMAPDRWYMISAPLCYMYPGDYWRDTPCPFGDRMQFYTMLFASENSQWGDWSDTFNNPDIPMPAGFGFATWIDDETYSGEGSRVNGKQVMWFPKNDTLYNIYYAGSCDVFSTHLLPDRTSAIVNSNGNNRFIYEPVLNSIGEVTLTTTLPSTQSNRLIVGNPFMSHWDFNDFVSNNTGRIANSYYLLEGPDQAAFTTYNMQAGDANLIAPMQSIVVAATSIFGSNPTLKTNVTSMKQNNGNILRSASVTPNKLTIVAQKDGTQNHTRLFYKEGADNAYYSVEDSYKMFVDSITAPVTVYTRSSDNFALDVNFIGDFGQSIPLGIRTGQTGVINLEFEGVEDFLSGREAYLTDMETGEKIDLKETPRYSFDKRTTDLFLDNRFYLSFNAPSSGSTLDQGTTTVYTAGRRLHVMSSSNIREVQVFDMQGRKLGQTMNGTESSTLHRAPCTFYSCDLEHEGVYIVKVLTEQGTVVKKVVL